MKILRMYTCSSREVSKFPYKELYYTKGHIVIINVLDPQNNLNDAEVIEETLWMVSNLMLAPKEYLTEFLKFDLLDKLSKYLSLKSTKTLKSIYWSLANLLGELPNMAHEIISKGFVDFLLDNSDNILDDSGLEDIVAWFISNLFREGNLLNGRILQLLMDKYFELLYLDINKEAVTEMITAVKDYLDMKSANFDDRIQFLISREIRERLVEMGHSKHLYIRNTVLEIIGKISSAKVELSQYLVCEEIRDLVIGLLMKAKLDDPDNCVNKVVWIISNLVVNSKESCLFFSTNNCLVTTSNLVKESLCEYKSRQMEVDFLDQEGAVINNTQYNMWNLFRNIYDNLYGQKYRDLMVKDLALIDLLLECLELENCKLIIFLLQFLNNILKNALNFYGDR
jgi:hypothetical protein